jgi:hypothetical protein
MDRATDCSGETNLGHQIVDVSLVTNVLSFAEFHFSRAARANRDRGEVSRLRPSHTTGRTGPYPAVRWIMQAAVPRRKPSRGL